MSATCIPPTLFLLGSGVSTPDLPLTAKISETILSGVKNGPSSPESKPLGVDEGVLRLLSWLKGVAENSFRIAKDVALEKEGRNLDHEVNYEDVFYLVHQLWYLLTANVYLNPATSVLLEKLENEIGEELGRLNPGKTGMREAVDDVVRNAKKYVERMVRELLQAPQSPNLERYQFLLDAVADSTQPLDVFTLNHDKLIELYLENEQVSYTCGFDERTETGDRIWSPKSFANPNARVRLYKLHGSLDWRATSRGHHVIPRPGFECVLFEGKSYPALDQNVLLIGTYNKVAEYTRGIFQDLYSAFTLSLRSCQNVIVAGYGFGDLGINDPLLRWFERLDTTDVPRRKLLIIDPGIDRLRTSGYLTIDGRWESWVKTGRFYMLGCGIECVPWATMNCILEAS